MATTVVKDTVRFLREYATTPGLIGAVAPSTKALATVMCDALEVRKANAVVEYGPGTGALTDVVIDQLKPGAKFFAIEHNERFVDIMRERRPDVKIFHDTAENVESLCKQEGMNEVDCVVSGLPFSSFPDALQLSLTEGTTSVLRPGGRFATFAYWTGVYLPAGQRFKRLIESKYAKVTRTKTVLHNIPPAFVYCCETAS